MADNEKRFGVPHTKTLASQEQVSTITWRVKDSAATLTETQGTLRAVFEVKR